MRLAWHIVTIVHLIGCEPQRLHSAPGERCAPGPPVCSGIRSVRIAGPGAVYDATIYTNAPYNFGASAGILVGYTNDGAILYRSIVGFDSDLVPAGELVAFRMHIVQVPYGTPPYDYSDNAGVFDVYRVTEPWIEGRQRGFYESEDGAVDWYYRSHPDAPWSGAEYSHVADASPPSLAYGPANTGDATAWVIDLPLPWLTEWRDGAPNHGMLLKERGAYTGENLFRGVSSDGGDGGLWFEIVVDEEQ